MWHLQHGSLSVWGLLIWGLAALRASIPRQAGGRYVAISDRALEAMQLPLHPFHSIPLGKSESLKVNPDLRIGDLNRALSGRSIKELEDMV